MKINKKYDYWIRSSKFTAITKFSNLFIGILLFMILARILGHDNRAAFGVWGLFMTISSITETARISLIRNAYIRFMNQTEEHEHEGLQASAFVLRMLISVILAGAFFILSSKVAVWLNAPGMDLMLRWYALTLLINTIFAHCEMTLTAKMDFRGVSIMYVLRQCFLLAVIVIYWLFKLPITPVILSVYYMVSVIVGSLVGVKLSSAYLKWTINNYKKWVGRLWQFGKYVFGTNISALLFRSVDTFLTSAYISPGVSAFYNASNRIGNLIDMPSQVLADVAFTKATQINQDDKRSVKNMYEKTVGAILTFSLPALAFLLIFPGFILRVVAGSAFLDAVPILRFSAFFGFIAPFMRQYGTVMDATGYPHLNFYNNFLSVILSVIFIYLGVHVIGFMGAAVGTAATYLVIFAVAQWTLYKKFEINFIQVFKYMFEFYGKAFTMAKSYTKTGIYTVKA
ncbi:MAG TPA: oligosaccharide flippase family protein [Flavisolibacter sp.]|nr:oligosaccharide flippase family protein [Flavisolibacter sp.]